MEKILVPDIGDFDEVEVIEVLVAVGDQVAENDVLITLESDKATMEVPSSAAGTIKEIAVSEGDKVAEGAVILLLETSESAEKNTDSNSEAAKAADKKPEKAEAKTEPSQGSKTTTVTVPDIGDFSDIPVIEVLVAEGDEVSADQALLTLESDKATMEVPAPSAGKIIKLLVKEGDTVSKGDEVLQLAGADSADENTERKEEKAQPEFTESPTEQSKPEQIRKAEPAKTSSTPVDEKAFAKAHASPSIRKFARELGVDLGRVKGSGRKSRITKNDVQEFVKTVMKGQGSAVATSGSGLPVMPEVDFSKFGPVEEKELARIRKLSAQNLHRNWVVVPHVTQFDEADITEMEAFRKAQSADGVKLTPLAFLLKACAMTLKEMPEFNSSIHPDGERLIMKEYCHIGFAADTDQGLVVPVIRDVDKKGLVELANECRELAGKAREGKLGAADMQGGCFTISSLGGIGGTAFTPIVNAPEVAILGVSKSDMKPVWDGSDFQPRLMLPLSLSYDHRVIDGAKAARFTVHLAGLLSDIRRLLL